jgi:hypothetical protein
MADSKLPPAFDWLGYFLDGVNGDPFFHAFAVLPCGDYDAKSKRFVVSKMAVLDAMSEAEGTSFLLVPTKGRKVVVLHSLFLVDPMGKKTILVGTMGTRKNLPFKAVLAVERKQDIGSRSRRCP